MTSSHKQQDCSCSLFADAELSQENEENEIDQSDFEDEEEDQSMSTTSCNGSPIAASFWSSTTTGISSMDNSEHLRAVNSNCTLDDLLSPNDDDTEAKSELDADEGHVSDAEKPLDVDVNFVIDLNSQQQALPTPQELATPTITSSVELSSQNYGPLKHFLKPICTIGTGTFGRVELTQHKETHQYYALKSMYIPSILERRQLNHVFNEKKILSRLKHPFIVKMFDTAKDNRNLYMILEFLAGGELFSYLRMSQSLSSSIVKFYAAEVLLALEYLHSLSIAYRDLKPENLMLCCDGHVKLTDFGFAKEIHSKSYSLCGTTAYLAPELANREGHDAQVDCWALGILIFELVAGFTPFPGSTVDEVQACIQACNCRPDFPRRTFSPNNKSIILQLLSFVPEQRKTVPEIKQHPWFEDIPFDDLLTKKIKAPIIPTVFNEGDTGNFDSYEEIDKQPPAKQRDLDLFDEW